MENIYTIASSSSSTTYGNIMTAFKEMLTQCFSANYFTQIFLASEISYVNIRKRLGRNTLNEMAKLERPFMNIVPQIQPPSGDMYLYDIPLTKNFDNMEYGIQKNTLFPIAKNNQDGYAFYYKLNRDRIEFEVTITVSTLIQQLDLYKYLLNHMVWERPFTVNRSIEAMIPKEIIRNMGKISGINIDESQGPAIMLRTINEISRYPITYKMRNGTSLDEYFMYYAAQLLITYTDLSIDQVSRKNMIDEFYQISFKASVEFNLPGSFILTGNDPRPDIINVSIKSQNQDGSHDLIPLYTINNFYARYTQVKNGYVMHTSTRFQTERDPNTKKDTLDMSVLFEEPYLNVIKKFHTKNIPIGTLVDLILLRDGEELNDNSWSVNWGNFNLMIENADDSATYCLIIYINNNLFSENIINDIEDSQVDKPRA